MPTQAWKSSDGKFFDTEEDCRIWERNLDLIDGYRKEKQYISDSLDQALGCQKGFGWYFLYQLGCAIEEAGYVESPWRKECGEIDDGKGHIFELIVRYRTSIKQLINYIERP